MAAGLAGAFHDPGRLLTRRERDCLRHLENGLTTAATAAALGISRSTLNAHLMSARRKLNARNTTQALLTLAKTRTDRGHWNTYPMFGAINARQDALVERLAVSETFGDAWGALHDYAAPLGVVAVSLGVVADPTGTLDHRACSFWSSLPDELVRLYHAMGGVPADPVAPFVARARRPLIVDPDFGLGVVAEMPPPTLQMLTALLDSRLHRMVCIPQRDPATGAVVGLSFAFDFCSRSAFEATVAAVADELVITTAIFWEGVQRRRLLADTPGLSAREREALVLLSQGHTLAGAAERIGVSLRSVEKVLAGARTKLGSRTNAQSLYRAMVYRAFS